MIGGENMLTPVEKIYFWSGIMRDHAEFFLLTLSHRETEFINTAQYYKSAFESLGNEAKQISTNKKTAVVDLTTKTFDLLKDFINFKQLAVRRLLKCEIELNMPPSFINHMINEAMEFYRDISDISIRDYLSVVEENILLHKIWLPDASGHAAAIADELDPTETMYIKQAQEFQKAFDNLFIKAVELGQMLDRAYLDNGTLEWFNKEVEEKIKGFIKFLTKIMELREKCKILGTLDPLMPDHMIREEKYYLANIPG